MSSPELTLQTAKGVSNVHLNLNDHMKVVTNPEIDTLVGYTGAVKGYPVVQANHTEITGNKSTILKRIRIKFKNGSQAVVYTTKTGTTVVISGKRKYTEISKVVESLLNLRGMTYEITNTTMTWQLHRKINLVGIEMAHKGSASYLPERFPALTLTLRDPLVSLKIFTNGVVIASGKDMTNIKARVLDVVSNFFIGGSIEHQLPARKNLKGKREHMRNERYPVVNWENNTEGYYVKPGPNRKPRRYKLPTNPRLVISKLRKAYANAGVPIPAATRRALGLSPGKESPKNVIPNNATMMNIANMMIAKIGRSTSPIIKETKYEKNYSPPKKNAKNLLNWDAIKPGYYIKPGPGGLPKFYKIPKGVKAAKKTVLKAYQGAGVRIPNKVRMIFEITPSPVRQSPVRQSPIRQNSPKGPRAVLKNQTKVILGGKDCMRYTVKELREIMRKRSIAYSGLTKPKMCAKLYAVNRKSPSPQMKSPSQKLNFSVLRNTEQIRRGSRVKKLSSFTKSNLIGFADKLGLGHSSKATKKNLMNILIGKKSPQQKSVSSSSSLGNMENELLKAFQEETIQNRKNNFINARAKLMFNNTNAPQFASYYRLHGGTPSKMNKLASNFRALKLKEQIGKYKNVEVM